MAVESLFEGGVISKEEARGMLREVTGIEVMKYNMVWILMI